MDSVTLAVFVFVYTGMIFGGFRGLALDRTGIVLLGAIAILATERLTPTAAWAAVDFPTIGLLFGLMVISAQFRLGGFYTAVARRLTAGASSPGVFLAQLLAISAVLSALLANDIICLALAPVVIEIAAARRLNPMPFLIGLACSSNIGSAATLIGNPQNMLIGQLLKLPFLPYLLAATVPVAIGLVACWAIIWLLYRQRWDGSLEIPPVERQPFDAWQTTKGALVLAALVVFFLWPAVPREVAALGAAGLLLLSRRMASPRFLSLIDWNLLVLFIGLFIVNHALAESGMLGHAVEWLRANNVDPNHGGVLFWSSAVLSNLVSNVPAVMLLLPSTSHPQAGLILALASTFAGNFILVGSIANIIVAEQAARLGVRFSAREHACAGIPITLATLAIAALWLFVA
ncbi:anion transporter [bacterium]|nr:anion transporter [bacterium]